MEQKKVIAYQKELFDINGESAECPCPSREAVIEADGLKALQVVSAGEHRRALVSNLMELVCSPDNLRRAYKQVKQNKGSCGTDGMRVNEFGEWFKSNGRELVEALKTGIYQPQSVRLVAIPKPNGGIRELGIPTEKDRVIQEAISQILTPIYEAEFSESSYGFRPQRSAQQALQKASEYVSGLYYLNNGMLVISQRSIKRLKDKIKTLTRRKRGVKFEQIIVELKQKLRGWLNYFRYAKCYCLVKSLDSWIRRKLRCYRLKQCKRVHTMQQFLYKQGVEKRQSWILALSGKGLWRQSGCPQAHQAMGFAYFTELKLYNLTSNYETLNNLQKPPCTKVRTGV